jgi:hypothetical protein
MKQVCSFGELKNEAEMSVVVEEKEERRERRGLRKKG